MAEQLSFSVGIADRYATAILDLAKEGKIVQDLEADIELLEAACAASSDLRELISSPIYSREDTAGAIAAVAAAMKLTSVVANSLSLMAQNRRLFVLPQLLQSLRERIAAEKGQVLANVVSAKALTKAQQDGLSKVLKKRLNKDINLNATVDESLIGGMIVRVGSTMVDTSIRSRLDTLKHKMKEAG